MKTVADYVFGAIRKVAGTEEPERFAEMNTTLCNVARTAVEAVLADDARLRESVRKMRAAQRGYFRSRTAEMLRDSKYWESRVDLELDENKLFTDEQ